MGDMKRVKVLFLDRDGVINVDHGYVCKPEEFEFIDGIFELCAAAILREYKIIIVTNQAGIGRGYYNESEFKSLTDWMCNEFSNRGIHISAVYFCPYHPEHGIGDYKRFSNMRKPSPGMLLRAEKEHNIDMNSSLLVGDKLTDIEAGISAGVQKCFLFNHEKFSETLPNTGYDFSLINRLSDVIEFLQ